MALNPLGAVESELAFPFTALARILGPLPGERHLPGPAPGHSLAGSASVCGLLSCLASLQLCRETCTQHGFECMGCGAVGKPPLSEPQFPSLWSWV